MCDVKRFTKCFYITICNQNIIFHEKNIFFYFNPLFQLKLNFLRRQAWDLRGLLVCFNWCNILTEKDENSLLSICSIFNPNVPGPFRMKYKSRLQKKMITRRIINQGAVTRGTPILVIVQVSCISFRSSYRKLFSFGTYVTARLFLLFSA